MLSLGTESRLGNENTGAATLLDDKSKSDTTGAEMGITGADTGPTVADIGLTGADIGDGGRRGPLAIWTGPGA